MEIREDALQNEAPLPHSNRKHPPVQRNVFL